MRRYGDNISREDDTEEETVERPIAVFRGGCSAAYGAFPPPADRRPPVNAGGQSWSASLLSFLGLRPSERPKN